MVAPALISSHCLAALLSKISGFNSHMWQNACYRSLKRTFVAMWLLRNEDQQQNNPLESFATCACRQTNGHEWVKDKLITSQCMTPEEWTWLLCSVTVIPANKMSLQELNQKFCFLEIFGSKSQFPGGRNCQFCFPCESPWMSKQLFRFL